MDYLALSIIGLITGILYNEQISRSAKKGKNPIISFPIRFFLLGILLYIVIRLWGVECSVVFTLSHLLGRFLQLCYRTFINP
ncbi:MAG: hypothetical protein DSY42_03305 [Aquifex sp.]|nr:MAG: hypothetical protein DSY42_03305 [Aquifex sp.]